MDSLLNVSRETSARIDKYIKLLEEWNSKINLVSSGDIKNVMTRHILDSLQLLAFIDDKNISVLDMGSGAGFPGLILSLCDIKYVTLVESNKKKCRFLSQASKISEQKITLLNNRIEMIKKTCDILTARAVADLDSIFSLTQHIIVKDKYLLHKGRSYDLELDKARTRWCFDYIIHDSVTGDGKIIEIKKLKRK